MVEVSIIVDFLKTTQLRCAVLNHIVLALWHRAGLLLVALSDGSVGRVASFLVSPFVVIVILTDDGVDVELPPEGTSFCTHTRRLLV